MSSPSDALQYPPVIFGPSANCTLEICDLEWSVYKYRPSLPANISFLALYASAMILHAYLGYRWRSYWFAIFMIFGCLSEIIGYAGRVIMWGNPFSFIGFMLQITCVTGGPVFYTAAIYVTLSKTTEHFAPELSRIRPKLYYYFFIPADAVCLVLQAAGGALSTVSQGVSQIGTDLAMAGLVLQVIFIFAFIVLFADYMLSYVRSDKRSFDLREKLFLGFLATAIVFILGRCIFRCYELSEGYSDSNLISNEGLFIALEGVLVYVAVLCLCIGHPGFIFTGAKRANGEGFGESRGFALGSFTTKSGSAEA